MFNVQQITDRLASMSDQQLQQYAQMHKDDPYILPLAASEFKRRQQTRAAAQQQQQAPQQTVADQDLAQMQQAAAPQQMPSQVTDQLPEQQGIGRLPAQNLEQMADGGIVGYAEGGKLRREGMEPEFANRLAAFEEEYERRYKRKAPITSMVRTRQEQQELYDEWKRLGGGPNKKTVRSPKHGSISTPANPANFPGREVFHENAADIDLDGVPKELLWRFGLTRPLPDDQVHVMSLNKWERDPKDRSEAMQNYRKRLADQQSKQEAAKWRGFMSKAPAAVTPAVIASPTGASRVPEKDSLSAGEEIVYSPEGIPLNVSPSAPESTLGKRIVEGVKEAGTSAVNLADTAWNFLPSLGAQVAYPIARATGSSPEQATQEVGRAASDFMSPFGKLFGVTESPYYKNAPSQQAMDFVNKNLTKSADWVAKQAKKELGIDISPYDVENMQNSLLLGAPKVASKAFRGDYTVPYNLGTKPRANVSEAVKAAEEAAARVENPRLAFEPEGSKPQITVNPKGEAVLPNPELVREANLLKQRGMEKLAEDRRVADIARAEAEAAKARAGEISFARSAERSPLAATIAGLTAAGAANMPAPQAYERLMSNATAPEMSPVPSGWFSDKPGTDGKNPGESPAAKENSNSAAKTETAKKGWGISDEDLLMLGLNLMASPGGGSGNSLQQFVSDLGRSGIATLAARKEREETAENREYKKLLGDYYKALGARQTAEADYLTENRGLDSKLKMATPAITQRFNAWLKQRSAALLGEPPTQAEQDAVMAKIQSDVYKALGLTDMLPAEDTKKPQIFSFNMSTGKIE